MIAEKPPILVLHLIVSLSRGGPGRSLLASAIASSEGGQVRHLVATLTAPDPWMARKAREQGMEVRQVTRPSSLTTMVADADIVLVHFWNHPLLYEALAHELPATRLLVWAHVSGEQPPQVLPPQLLDYADLVLASCALTASLPGMSGLEHIPDLAGWERVGQIVREPDRPFTVGYIGKLDFAKLHPNFVGMCAALRVPGARFIVCGAGGAAPVLRRQAVEAGLEDRFELWSFVEDIGRALRQMDVFGYPLHRQAYAASELVLQEAMYAAVPPVVLGPPALRHLVSDGSTGLVADTESGYVRALKEMHDHPDLRLRMGEAAHEHAARNWSPTAVAPRWRATFDRLMQRPKKVRQPYPLAPTGARRFIDGLGASAPQFLASLCGSKGDAAYAESQIAESSGPLFTGDGGILNYRDRYPEDPHLRLWAGLLLHHQGRPVLAAGEFAAAIRLGLDAPRVRRYLAVATRHASTRQSSGPRAALSTGSVTIPARKLPA